MEFKAELKRIKMVVDAELAQQLDHLIDEMEQKDALMTETLVYLKKIILAGGKRVRPAMMIYGHIAAGGKETSALVQAAVGVELAHTFLLMHDDIMDRDDVRHGELTMHTQYKERASLLFERGDAEHFGVSTAILVGDFCHALSNKMIFTAGFDAQATLNVLIRLEDVVQRTVRGQFQDIVLEYTRSQDEEHILGMYKNKTARYTFEGPLHMGALLADGDEKLLASLSTFALPLGVAFQMQDDVLGIFGSAEKTGKSVGSDIEEGKMTLLVSRAYQKADSVQKKHLDGLLGKEGLQESEVEIFRGVLRDTGALASVESDIAERLNVARASLESAKYTAEVEDFLMGMVEYLSQREV